MVNNTNYQYQRPLNTEDESTPIDLSTSAIVCIALVGYLTVVVIALFIRQILLNRGVCSGLCTECCCCPAENEPCCPCCLECLRMCNCDVPRCPCSSCADCLCPVKQNLTCVDIVFCQCCEFDCCGGKPLCEVNLYRLTEYPETYCECCVAINNRRPIPGVMPGAAPAANPWSTVAAAQHWYGQSQQQSAAAAAVTSPRSLQGAAGVVGAPNLGMFQGSGRTTGGALSPGAFPFLSGSGSAASAAAIPLTEQPRSSALHSTGGSSRAS